MDWRYLLTSFEGRTDRINCWYAMLALTGAGIAVSAAMTLVAVPDLAAGPLSKLVPLVIVSYPATAVMIKRLHDRDRPGWIAAIYWSPIVLILLGQLLGIGGTNTDVFGTPVFRPNQLGWTIYICGLITALWALIELGFLRGTDGPNQHGPDPLQQ